MKRSLEQARPLAFDPIAEAHQRWIGRWPEADRMAACQAVIRVSRIVISSVERVLAPYDLTFARYEVLGLLAFSRNDRLPLSKIGARLQVHPTSVTSAVDRLEKQGFVRRVGDPSDRRTTLAVLTDEGRDLVDKITSLVVETQFGLGALGQHELAQLSQILLLVRQSAGDFEPPADGAAAADSP